MPENRDRKKRCVRFSVQGTVLHYKRKFAFFRIGRYTDDYFPVIDLSRGGLCFLSQTRLKANARLRFKILVPGEEKPLRIDGHVRWVLPDPGMSYAYRIGVQFAPYDIEKRGNSIESLETLKRLEATHAVCDVGAT